ncbi:epimerase [Saccharospirillum sp. MSK14-1]|uniref:SDR family oxidoreductase n=1 Tax=Saccharospirillum sp. MSK14-1 TaxID=1897632 RepID=UPI000D333571|nr:SDR family oxidoreductase [Saccharospirillum sp. MSK14-1]PTY38604.1 epimerase [Saccharospirillum sp. MSK14-1]
MTHILITGASGYLGYQLGCRLSQHDAVTGLDIRPKDDSPFPIEQRDITSDDLADWMDQEAFTHVIHLASVLEPSRDRERDYRIDVDGTDHLLAACVATGVRHFTLTSSGAAYGYHPDNPDWLTEQDALRGNVEFSYAWHKRLVEERLADYRQNHPELRQLILRPGTVLGRHTHNLITRLFEGKRLIALSGASSPFVFIWDQDVLAIIEQGVRDEKSGIYNLAGDGAVTMDEIANQLGKPIWHLPVPLVRFALGCGRRLGLTPYGPEQLNFLRYRPVLANTALKQEFGYSPRKTSAEVLAEFAAGLQVTSDA